MPGQYSPNGLGTRKQQTAINDQSGSRIREDFGLRHKAKGTRISIEQRVTFCLGPDALSHLAKGAHMETKTLSIPNISCGHCVMTIKKELSEVEGISKVEGDPAGKSITLDWDAPATLERIKEILGEINYPAAD